MNYYVLKDPEKFRNIRLDPVTIKLVGASAEVIEEYNEFCKLRSNVGSILLRKYKADPNKLQR